jgi:protein-L-isoaspartate(D-aspartate) O-methyltransferase
MQDTYRHKGLRRMLLEDLRAKGISNERVLNAIDSVPRHFFLDKAFEEWAYTDKAFPIGNNQTISQPYTVAYQTSMLNVQKGDKILEIGTGSGYQASVLAILGAKVHTVERHEVLYKAAKKLLIDLGFSNSIRTYFRDGNLGVPEFAPFDKIIITAGAKEIPLALRQQLTIGGMMVIPVGDDKAQKMTRITRISNTEFEDVPFDDFRFVPFLKGVNKG